MELKKYQFSYGRFGQIVLDDQGHEHRVGLADDRDVEQLLEGSRETSPSEHLDRLTRLEMDRHPALSYRQALSRVQDRRPDLVRLHASESAGRVRVYAGAG